MTWYDLWLLCTDEEGQPVSSVAVWDGAGATQEIDGRGMAAYGDGVVVAGSTGIDPKDMFAMALDSAGTVLWARSVVGAKDDVAEQVLPVDGALLLQGWSTSLTPSGARGLWLARAEPNGALPAGEGLTSSPFTAQGLETPGLSGSLVSDAVKEVAVTAAPTAALAVAPVVLDQLRLAP